MGSYIVLGVCGEPFWKQVELDPQSRAARGGALNLYFWMQQHDNIKEVALRLMWNGYSVSTGVIVPEPENNISIEFSDDVCIGLQGWLVCHACELCIQVVH
jgi:hypothetical protein